VWKASHAERALILDIFQTDAERSTTRASQGDGLSNYKASYGRQVLITERVAAFHRAEQRNDVEMIFP